MTTRRLAAILAADVVGFSSMMEKDEEGTLQRIKALHRQVIEPHVKERGGRVVKTTGDGFLCEFGSPVEAVRCALEVQEATRNGGGETLLLRMGINLGDIIVEQDGDIYGDGVNIAARLEQMAEPGGLCISGSVHEHAEGKVPVAFESKGEQQVKNIARPVRIYALPGATRSVSEPKPLPLPDKPSIAVLPFTNMSGDPEQEYFADGISEDILTALSRIKWLFVIARNSSFVFKGRAADMKLVGQQLGVRYALEGSVRKAGNRLRITAQLIETTQGAHVWADRYDGDLSAVFDLQDEITRKVVSAIEPTVLAAEIERARAKAPDDLAAYDLYLRALPDFHSFTEAGFRRAHTLLIQAVQRAPRFSDAWAALADCVARLTYAGWIDDWAEGAREACAAARKAVETDPENGTALAVAAFTIAALGGGLDETVELANRALRLHPNSSTVCTNCAWVFTYGGEYGKALDLLDTARRLNPLDPRGYLMNNATAVAYFFAGHFEETERWTRRSLEKWPAVPVSLRYRAAALVHLGRVEEARAIISNLLSIQPNSTLARSGQIRHSDLAKLDMYLDALRQAGLPE